MRVGVTDKDLMNGFAQGRDERAFETLVRRWDKRVLSFLAKASGDPEAAEDLRQEVFIRVYRYAGSYKPDRSFPTWLFQIASNVLATWHAKEARGLRLLWSPEDSARPLRVVDPGPGPSELAALDELGRRIDDAMKEFTLVDRELLLFRLDLELSYPEIAGIVGAPESTVKSRFYSLVKRLRINITDAEEIGQTERKCYP